MRFQSTPQNLRSSYSLEASIENNIDNNVSKNKTIHNGITYVAEVHNEVYGLSKNSSKLVVIEHP